MSVQRFIPLEEAVQGVASDCGCGRCLACRVATGSLLAWDQLAISVSEYLRSIDGRTKESRAVDVD